MSDDDEFRAKKAFPVDDLLRAGGKVNLQPGEAPADAIEYLKFVAFEASQCKDVVVACIDDKKLKKQTVVYSANSIKAEKTSSSSTEQPSREWKICQVSDFSDLRSYLAKMKFCSDESTRKKKIKELPRRGDEHAWCIFCLGSAVARRNIDGVSELEVPANPPLASTICSMDQPMIEKLLEYHIGWLSSCGFSAQQGLWIYSLMAGLELPLTPDVCSLIRDLARSCASARDSMLENSDSNLTVPLNLIICLVAKYFRQLDLEDL